MQILSHDDFDHFIFSLNYHKASISIKKQLTCIFLIYFFTAVSENEVRIKTGSFLFPI